MYPVLIIFISFAIYISRTNLNYFESAMVIEGGFFQWMIFYTLLFASLMCFYRANILRPFRGKKFSIYLIISGFLFLAFAMDEMSWFQQVLGIKTPAFFNEFNSRKEINFHHLIIYGFHINNLVFTLNIKIFATMYFLVMPFLYIKFASVKNFVNKFAIPLPRYTQTAAYIALAGLVALIPSDLRYVIFEFGFYWIMVLMMYNPLNSEIFSRISLNR